ncbi:MAG: MFS transporter [Thermoleophilia bacterium]
MRAAPSRPVVVRGGGISRRLVLILTFATGAAVANLYYAQPLLHTLAEDFGASEGVAGLAVTSSQIGYALGLAFLVPLGDLVSRRRISVAVLAATAAMLLVGAAAPDIGLLIGALGLVGLGAVIAQVLVPLAAEMADPASRGRVVGTVMAGLLLGILAARILAGLIGDALGWRAVLVFGAIVAFLLAATLARELPSEGPRARVSYPGLLRSALRLARDEPALRMTSLIGALTMASFALFWTAIAFRLGGAPFRYSDTAIGLLGVAGLAGALAATRAGRLADRGLAPAARVAMGLVMAASWAALWASDDLIVVVVAATVTLDVGVQGMQILNQALIYALAPDAPSRVNSVYMTTYFVGGACGSAAAGALFDGVGWGAVCLAGMGLGAVAAALSARALAGRRGRPGRAAAPTPAGSPAAR